MEKPTFKPPYISTTKLAGLFDLIGGRSFSSLSVEDLTNREYTLSDASQSILALKFLGFLEPSGKTTARITALSLKGEERQKQLQEIVKSAYADLFAVNPQANTLTKDELFNEFVAVYKLSSRLASSATPAFLWLCSHAGLEVVNKQVVKHGNQSVRRRPTIVTKSPKYEVKTPPLSDEKPGFNTYPLNSGVIVQIPQKLSVEWSLDGTLKSKLENFETSEIPPKGTSTENKQGEVAESD